MKTIVVLFLFFIVVDLQWYVRFCLTESVEALLSNYSKCYNDMTLTDFFMYLAKPKQGILIMFFIVLKPLFN